jgi:hypothetical protein
VQPLIVADFPSRSPRYKGARSTRGTSFPRQIEAGITGGFRRGQPAAKGSGRETIALENVGFMGVKEDLFYKTLIYLFSSTDSLSATLSASGRHLGQGAIALDAILTGMGPPGCGSAWNKGSDSNLVQARQI